MNGSENYCVLSEPDGEVASQDIETDALSYTKASKRISLNFSNEAKNHNRSNRNVRFSLATKSPSSLFQSYKNLNFRKPKRNYSPEISESYSDQIDSQTTSNKSLNIAHKKCHEAGDCESITTEDINQLIEPPSIKKPECLPVNQSIQTDVSKSISSRSHRKSTQYDYRLKYYRQNCTQTEGNFSNEDLKKGIESINGNLAQIKDFLTKLNNKVSQQHGVIEELASFYTDHKEYFELNKPKTVYYPKDKRQYAQTQKCNSNECCQVSGPSRSTWQMGNSVAFIKSDEDSDASSSNSHMISQRCCSVKSPLIKREYNRSMESLNTQLDALPTNFQNNKAARMARKADKKQMNTLDKPCCHVNSEHVNHQKCNSSNRAQHFYFTKCDRSSQYGNEALMNPNKSVYRHTVASRSKLR